MFKLGLIINPFAGLGGQVALKGSDDLAEEALRLGAEPLAQKRAETALKVLLPQLSDFQVITVSGDMGEHVCASLGLNYRLVHQAKSPSTFADTQAAVEALMAAKVDLILFAGGDGTARNVNQVIDERVPVLGIPAGCKIHSGVYAITPKAAGQLVSKLIKGDMVILGEADVMDIDETAFRNGVVKAKRYGDMRIPTELRYVQAVKNGGKESDELVLADLAAYIIDEMDDDTRYIMGSGSTVAAIMAELNLPNTLLGVDVIENGTLTLSDATSQELLNCLSDGKPTKLVITLIGGQGHIFGRGNQQLSPDVIRKIGLDNIIIVATKTKLTALQGRPLICDTGDEQLDNALSGTRTVITGYQDEVLYRVGYNEE